MSQQTQPKPAFPLKPDQRLRGPLVLDRDHLVPDRINTFLRDYQREGIRFFWNRYKEGKGGLLGDDMGLVRGYKSSDAHMLTVLRDLGQVPHHTES